ncbi:HEPN domain-containing protein [Clostridium perfringens]|uniref:HEPN domain-containing protein n=1 Tax=Clostridium perfringens TaxID=1502 RepID=UPI0018E4551F|nr:HEPN domain-containing protein [Clostridium perfringens]MBI5991333.1 hypothetical protein [Clostridium perfringens]MDM1023646.1 hypothetical protein [Clostridium perfringens]MDU6980766.1 HEPN domain-containing protein [Clostridium perfringens]
MKIKHKLKPKVINEIIELRDSRNSVNDFTQNFIKNLSSRYCLMHEYLKEHKDNKEHIKILAGLYLSSLVSCWETFFRDVVDFIVETDEEANKKALDFFSDKGIKIDDILAEGICLGDFVSKQFNFQRLDDTCNAFNFLFNDNKTCITEYVSESSFDKILFSSPNFLLYYIQQKKDISMMLKETFTKVFDIRHKVIHDANFMIKIDVEFMSKVEDCFTIFPQLISVWVAKKYNQNLFVANINDGTIRFTNELNDFENILIFTKDDFTAEYNVVE